MNDPGRNSGPGTATMGKATTVVPRLIQALLLPVVAGVGR